MLAILENLEYRLQITGLRFKILALGNVTRSGYLTTWQTCRRVPLMTNHTATSTAILASDFSQKTTDVLRHKWTVAKMTAVIDALDGAPVAIIVSDSGFSLVGARLIAAFDGGASRGDRVTVDSDNGDGTTHRTNYWLRGVGETIIPLANPGVSTPAKWVAIENYRASTRPPVPVLD